MMRGSKGRLIPFKVYKAAAQAAYSFRVLACYVPVLYNAMGRTVLKLMKSLSLVKIGILRRLEIAQIRKSVLEPWIPFPSLNIFLKSFGYSSFFGAMPAEIFCFFNKPVVNSEIGSHMCKPL